MVNKTKEGWVRKIVTVDDPQDLSDLRDTLLASRGKIIKELPLINGFVCEFPEEETVLAVRNISENINVEEDIKFKLCYTPAYYFLKFLFPFPYNPQPKPESPETPLFQGARRVDWGLKRIGANKVWDKLKDRRVRVGIIDTGINTSHADLRKCIREGVSTLDASTSYLDDYGHGTHVAGIIGANNANGMVGVNPYVDFYIVKAFDKQGSGNLSDIIEGMDWLMRRNVNIINMSFSTSESSNSFIRAIRSIHQRGIIMVAAAGNDGGDVNYPARFPEVVAVSAIDKKDRFADFSSHGPEIDFCAPGVDIDSAWIGSGYAVKSGTSFAAPHITGAVADVLNYYGHLPSSQVIGLLAEKAVALDTLTEEQQGAGLVELPRVIE